MTERVYSCPKCKGLFFLYQWNEKTGKCKACSSKMHNKKVWVDGLRFDSMAESYEYIRLRDRERAGEISDLRRQVPYKVYLNGKYICKWLADFVYIEDGQEKVVDVKGFPSPVYKLKRKLVEAAYSFTIIEVAA